MASNDQNINAWGPRAIATVPATAVIACFTRICRNTRASRLQHLLRVAV